MMAQYRGVLIWFAEIFGERISYVFDEDEGLFALGERAAYHLGNRPPRYGLPAVICNSIEYTP